MHILYRQKLTSMQWKTIVEPAVELVDFFGFISVIVKYFEWKLQNAVQGIVKVYHRLLVSAQADNEPD